jgi:hypothetical protein
VGNVGRRIRQGRQKVGMTLVFTGMDSENSSLCLSSEDIKIPLVSLTEATPGIPRLCPLRKHLIGSTLCAHVLTARAAVLRAVVHTAPGTLQAKHLTSIIIFLRM